jgi:hypothetical protein
LGESEVWGQEVGAVVVGHRECCVTEEMKVGTEEMKVGNEEEDIFGL